MSSESERKRVLCPACRGTGELPQTTSVPSDDPIAGLECPACQGAGEVPAPNRKRVRDGAFERMAENSRRREQELERNLKHNIERAEKAEAELRDIKRRLGDFSRLLHDHRSYFDARA